MLFFYIEIICIFEINIKRLVEWFMQSFNLTKLIIIKKEEKKKKKNTELWYLVNF